MYCGLLRSIHGPQFAPDWKKPQAPERRRGRGPKNKEPRPLQDGAPRLSHRCGYLAGAFEVSVFDALDLLDFLLCFL